MLHCYQRGTKPWPRATSTESLMKFGRMVLEICSRTDWHLSRQTNMLITILHYPTAEAGRVMILMLIQWQSWSCTVNGCDVFELRLVWLTNGTRRVNLHVYSLTNGSSTMCGWWWKWTTWRWSRTKTVSGCTPDHWQMGLRNMLVSGWNCMGRSCTSVHCRTSPTFKNCLR